MLRVCTFKWSDPNYRFNKLFLYGAEHVNRWARAVRRNLSIPHEIVVITDDPAGITEDVRIVPLWDDLRHMGGCYTRLRAFAPDMAEIIGPRFVWMDLDCVIAGSLDEPFSRKEDFIIWHNGISNNPYCGSMVMMDAGARKEVWEDFDPATSPQAAKPLIGTDQAWIAHRLGPDEATWTRADGILSRYHTGIGGSRLMGRAIRNAKKALPEGARVVFFHGPLSPCQPHLQAACPWIQDNWY